LIRGKRATMIILLYFDWGGSRKELKEWNERIVEACDKAKVKYLGLYGSMNVKWNYVGVFETESFDVFLEMGKCVNQPPCMIHYITEILLKQNL
jgi:hypothetical protein